MMKQGKDSRMNVLIVSNEYTSSNRIGNPIIERIINSTRSDKRVNAVDFIPFTNKVADLYKIRRRFTNKDIDIIHIQFGGLYALIIWFFLLGINKPKIITFHGTDLHAGELATTKSHIARARIRLNRLASIVSICVFKRSGIVSDSLINFIPKYIYRRRSEQIFQQQLGVDFNLFTEKRVDEAQNLLGVKPGRYFLFSDKSNTPIKRKDIAEKIVSLLGDKGIKLLVMCGVDPKMVPNYINASEAIILTSDMEGSPNIVREALALNKRVFSVDVGDVKEQIMGLKDSCIISRDYNKASAQIKECMEKKYSDNTRRALRERLDMDLLTQKVVDIYIDALRY